MNLAVEAIVESYHRCEASDGFFDTFYKLFFAKSPEIPPKFAKTDMEKQKQIVMASLLWMLRLNEGDPIAQQEIARLKQSHGVNGLDVKPELYEYWVDALCEAIAIHDPQNQEDLQAMWRAAMRAGIDLMTSS